MDWSLPAWVRPAAFSGFYSEQDSPGDQIYVRSVDVSWAQVRPRETGPLDLEAFGDAQGMSFDSLRSQLAEPGPYWVRMFSSGVDWAPPWVADKCGVAAIGTDYDGQDHLPLWNECVWTELAETWRMLLRDEGILADPDFRFAYVPGGFTWSEFDYEMMSSAAEAGALDEATYLAWFDRMLTDLAEIAGPQVGRLVFTGEDYPWGPFGGAENLLAGEAVARGFGVRNGITEEFNFHLNETPAYRSSIRPDGHLVVADSWLDDPAPPGAEQVVGTENECFVDCGFNSLDPAYVMTMANLKALQLRMNWLYVVPGPSLMDIEPAHWDWMRLSLGQRPQTAADAWVALREAEDRYWADKRGPFTGGRRWATRPWTRNFERWVEQVDMPGAVAHRTEVDVHRRDPTRENGTSYEGLRTDVASGNTALAFRIDRRFLATGHSHDVVIQVTYFDDEADGFRLQTPRWLSPTVHVGSEGGWHTASFRLRLHPGRTLADGSDFRVLTEGGDLSVRMVRVIRLDAPRR